MPQSVKSVVNLPLKGLLCDLDGTLADSEPIHCAAWLDMLAGEYDIHYEDSWFDQWVGTSDLAVADYLIDHYNMSISSKELIAKKQALGQEVMRREGRLFDGLDEWLARIAERFPLAIATNSGRADADIMIAATGLDRHTGISVTATDVSNIKPAPDIYLLAAERLGLAPENCIAIEDSSPGGESARAAGCYVIGVTEKVAVAHEFQPDGRAALARAYELLMATDHDLTIS